MKKKFNNISKIVLMGLAFVIASCGSRENTSSPETSTQNDVEVWLTKADESVKLQKQNVVLGFTTNANNYQNIEINPTEIFQSIDGFGYTLTGGSVEVINQLSPAKRSELLQEIYGNGAQIS